MVTNLFLQVDYNNNSALGGMTPMTATMSVTSSIYNFVEEMVERIIVSKKEVCYKVVLLDAFH
jgi:hypothetical protein